MKNINCKFMTKELSREFQNSSAASGRDDIGRITWNNAKAYIRKKRKPLFPESDRQIVESWLSEFGAWGEEEISALSFIEIQALILQFIASEKLSPENDRGYMYGDEFSFDH